MMGRYIVLILFAYLVEGVFGEEKSVNDGDPVVLKINVTKQPNDMVRWYFNDSLIALINGDPKATCLYDGEGGRFRNRLMLDCMTGSLIITDITTEHAGPYEAKLKGEDPSGKIIKLDREPKCESTKIIPKNGNLDKTIKSISLTVNGSGSGLSSGEVAGIVGGVLLWATAVVVGVIYYHHRSCRNDMKKNKQMSESFLQTQIEKV